MQDTVQILHTDVLGDQILWSGITVWLIQKLKESKKFPVIDEYTDTLNKGLSMTLAAVGTAGIHFQMDWEQGTLLVSGLTAAVVLDIAKDVLTQFFMQQAAYHSVMKKGSNE